MTGVRSINTLFRFGAETPEIKAKRAAALRKAYVAKQKKLDEDPNSWWNRVRDITFKEAIHDMPNDAITKYYKMYLDVRDFHDDQYLLRKAHDERYHEHLSLKRLISDKEKEDLTLMLAKRTDEDISPNKLDPEMNKVQPRNTNVPNYNFEQYTGFTKIYNEQMEKDRQKQLQIKRIYKYIQQNPNEEISKSWKKFLLFGDNSEDHDIQKFVDDNISIKGFRPPSRNMSKRKYIRTRSSRDISDYDCWRNFDRKLYVDMYHLSPQSKITLSPTELRWVFGQPEWKPSDNSTGIYNFEDTFLDIFVLAEPHSTVMTRGLNKADEYYNYQKTLYSKRIREKKRPSAQEFWFTDEPRVFFIHTTPNAAFRKFKIWLRKTIAEGMKQPSLAEQAEKKYGNLYSLYDDYEKDYDEFNERGVETMGSLHISWADYLDKQELKKYKNEIPDKIISPEFLPLDKATKLELTREELEEMYEKERAKLEGTDEM